jgi:hypothetical protein
MKSRCQNQKSSLSTSVQESYVVSFFVLCVALVYSPCMYLCLYVCVIFARQDITNRKKLYASAVRQTL